MRILTLKQLTEAHACETQVELFTQHFGASVEVTELLAESLADEFDFAWAGKTLLSHAARAEYWKGCAPARAEYYKAHDAARAEYLNVCDDDRDENLNVCDAAQAKFEKARDAALAEYQKRCAVTFANLYIADQT